MIGTALNSHTTSRDTTLKSSPATKAFATATLNKKNKGGEKIKLVDNVNVEEEVTK